MMRSNDSGHWHGHGNMAATLGLAAAVLMLVAAFPLSAAWADDWIRIGSRSFTLAGGPVTIPVTHRGAFKALRLQNEGRRIVVTQTRAIYRDGSTFSSGRRITLGPRDRTRPFATRSAGKPVSAVVLTLEAAANQSETAIVAVWGLLETVKAPTNEQVAEPVRKPERADDTEAKKKQAEAAEVAARAQREAEVRAKLEERRRASEERARAAQEADARAKAEADARARLAAQAREAAEAQARAESERLAEARRRSSGSSAPGTGAPTAAPSLPKDDEADRGTRAARPAVRPAPPKAAESTRDAVPRSVERPPPPVIAREEEPRSRGAEEPPRSAASEAPPPSVADAPRPTPDVAPPAQTEWDIVPVFYGTDRANVDDAKRIQYGAERAKRLQLGRALVTVPKVHQVPNVERPWAIRIPYLNITLYEQAEDPRRHFTVKEVTELSKEELLVLVRKRLEGSAAFKDHALVFIHGFDNTFDWGLYRTAQIAYDLKFDGAPFQYSWPSKGAFGATDYGYDRESAVQAEPYFRAFMELVVKESGAKHVSVIAHSMGNQLLLTTLRSLKPALPEGVTLNQIILAAPDVDRDGFEFLAREIMGVGRGITLLAAGNDRALGVSKRFWGGVPRAGDVPPSGPVVVDGIDTIDITATSTDLFALNHNGFAEKTAILADLQLLIQTGQRPPSERVPMLELVPTPNGPYWRYPRP